MVTKIFHTVNAGLYLCNGRANVLIDGIHAGNKFGFSLMPDTLVKQMKEQKGIFSGLDNLLFTHFHEDHYDHEQLKVCMERSRPTIYACDLEESNADSFPVCENVDAVRMDHVYLLSLHNIHEGEMYKNDIHRSYLLRIGEEIMFIAGDAILNGADAELLMKYADHPVSGAFLNPYQIASKNGQDFIRILSPERVFMIHLPFKEDDIYNVWLLGRNALRVYPDNLPPVEVLQNMSWVDGKMPERIDGKNQVH